MAIRKLDPAYLAECFTPNFEAGTLTWRVRPESHFANPAIAKRWNTRNSGKPALHNLSANGYRVGTLDNQAGIRAHRVLYTMAHGVEPDSVDHINGDSLDNRLTNLRSVSHLINCRNRRLQSNNTSGVCGVTWCRQNQGWLAQIGLNGRNHNLGIYKTKEAAAAARKSAEIMNDFGPAHGASV